MKHSNFNAHRLTVCMLFSLMAVSIFAVPARRGWQTRTQSDGSTIEVQVIGDEFYHYTINREGQQVREINGMYEVIGEAPAPEVAKARRAKAVARRQRKDVGTEPYPAPRGLLILANFSDKSFQSSNSKAVMDSLINAKDCQVNNGFGSAAQYFKDQSYGQYQPVFDVVGPVTLSNKQNYYGQNVGSGDNAEDKYATDAVIEACILANNQVNFADYDWNNDGYVDFVYVIYAGKGEADGGAASTIWPHNYSIQEVIKYKGQGTYSVYSKSDTKLDGKYLDNYAMSQEIDGQTGGRAGNGTFCHEFGHVIGLPDFYDTEYGSNYSNQVTPNEWDIMDGGGYNGDGHCPPNYSAWEKYFMGWVTPENLGSQGAKLTLYPNGTIQHNVYQINTSGKLQTATTEGLNYYIECRQKTGWDTHLPAAGMLIWKVNFNAQKWEGNEPNNTAGNPRYTLAIPSGTKIGSDYGSKNVWPYNSTNSWSGVSGKPLKDITKSNNLITLTYIEEPAPQVEPFQITWIANGEVFATTTSTGKVVLPSDKPEKCDDGKVFVGWTKDADFEETGTAPVFVVNGESDTETMTYYAVYAIQDGEGEGAEETTRFTFTSKSWGDATNSWTSTKDGNLYDTGKQGVQVTSNSTGAGATTTKSFEKVSKVTVTYCTNATRGEGKISVSIGNIEKTLDITKTGGAELRNLEFAFDKVSGKAAIEVTCTTNSIYINSVAITVGGGVSYSDYSLTCGSEVPEDIFYTIRFFDNGRQLGEAQSVLKGQQPSVPELDAPCGEYSFAGWWTSALASDNTTAYTWITDFKAVKDQDYYAVYSREEAGNGSSDEFHKISMLNELTDGNYVVAGNSAHAMKCELYNNYFLATKDVTAYSGTIFNPAADIIWKITRSGNRVSFYNEENDQYAYLYQADNYYDLGLHSSTYWFNASVTNGNWTFEASDHAGEYLVYFIYEKNGNTTHEFAAKANATETIQLFKQGEGSTVYYSSSYNCATTVINQTDSRQPAAVKAIRDGRMVILLGNEIYSLTGTRIQ